MCLTLKHTYLLHFLPGSVDLLLFQAESTEDQFHFYLQRVNNRLEGYKECFDWLLSEEEFHGDSDWLECMRNHAVEISEAQHALKIIDIIYMQRQSLCADNTSSDVVYKELKEVSQMVNNIVVEYEISAFAQTPKFSINSPAKCFSPDILHDPSTTEFSSVDGT